MDKLTYYPDYDVKKGLKLKTIDEKTDYLQKMKGRTFQPNLNFSPIPVPPFF